MGRHNLLEILSVTFPRLIYVFFLTDFSYVCFNLLLSQFLLSLNKKKNFFSFNLTVNFSLIEWHWSFWIFNFKTKKKSFSFFLHCLETRDEKRENSQNEIRFSLNFVLFVGYKLVDYMTIFILLKLRIKGHHFKFFFFAAFLYISS